MITRTFKNKDRAAHTNGIRAFDTEVCAVDPGSICFNDVDLENPTFTIADSASEQVLSRAKRLLSKSEVVAIPTETVYGLAANALDPVAVRRIYAAKNRPADNPLIVHISSLRMLRALMPNGKVPAECLALARTFWPGPLTLLFPTSPSAVPQEITCGLSTVAVRMPAHPVARALIAKCQFPLAAPSANASGRPSPTLASHVLADLSGRIPMIVDGGQCAFGVESTVLDALHSGGPVILRPGGVAYETLAQIPGMQGLRVYRKDFMDARLEEAPTTPGMKYRHYSPKATVVLIDVTLDDHDHDNEGARVRDIMRREIESAKRDGRRRIGVMWTSTAPPGEMRDCGSGANVISASKTLDNAEVLSYPLGDARTHLEQVARELFKGMRYLDDRGAECIIIEGVPEAREGLAVMNRLRKAASRVIT